MSTTPSDHHPRPTPPAERAWRDKHDELYGEIQEKRAKRAAAKRRNDAERTRRFAALCEASEGLAVAWRREGTPIADMIEFADGDLLLLNALARWLRMTATREIDRLRHAERRPLYYEQEKARRQELAAERRRVRRHATENPCPTKEEILDAWLKVKDSNEDLLRFGSLMEDLACYVDSSLVRSSDGVITSRRGGVKAWLQVNIPALYLKYTTVMRYKAAAKKLRQITGLAEPLAVARLVDAPGGRARNGENGLGEDAPEGRARERARNGEAGEDVPLEVVQARAVYAEVMAERPASRTAYLRRIDAFVDPDRVEEATMLKEWRERYGREITVRTKNGWMCRLLCAG